MTELTKYICDMCGAIQELNTSPQRQETTYVKFDGMVYQLDTDLSIQTLCPKCAGIVGQFIRDEGKRIRKELTTPSNPDEKENRVPTTR